MGDPVESLRPYHLLIKLAGVGTKACGGYVHLTK